MSALSTMRVNTMAKDVEAARAKASTRDAVVLLHRHLEDNGYGESADALAREAASALAGTTVADDISLERIFREHEEHYAAKHGAPPKLYTRESRPAGRDGRARDDDSEKTKTDVVGGAESGARGGARNGGVPSARTSTAIAPIVGSATARAASGALQAPDKDLGVVGVGAGEGAASRSRRDAASTSSRVRFADAPALGPDPDSGTPVDFGSEDLNALARVILRDVYVGSPDVRWDDVAGLAVAKKILREAVVAPFRYPALFTGLLRPWRGVLLHGPPGTGKTMLAKAVATESGGGESGANEKEKCVFFNVSASTVVSKYRGDSEKLVRVLFELARFRAPSVVFMDEIDALMCERGGAGGEHEASRRMKTELLIQLDGLDGASANAKDGDNSYDSETERKCVFLLAATNTPWALDPALLRRMEKRVFVGLPDVDARRAMFTRLLGGRKLAPEVSVTDLAAKHTENYSGSDVATLCKEMAMAPLRRLVASLDAGAANSARGKAEASAIGPITAEDVRNALATAKPSAANQLERHERWSAQFGQTG
jgi:katanin p60 ATPase-containing subunit A1|mmetsp:Transcript_5216/g.21048  ORF Transcript_5216/g.21048 Transcript_5216/m.21048 type:complete len:544 (+) Transcript_5216:143-1774(+)